MTGSERNTQRAVVSGLREVFQVEREWQERAINQSSKGSRSWTANQQLPCHSHQQPQGSRELLESVTHEAHVTLLKTCIPNICQDANCTSSSYLVKITVRFTFSQNTAVLLQSIRKSCAARSTWRKDKYILPKQMWTCLYLSYIFFLLLGTI